MPNTLTSNVEGEDIVQVHNKRFLNFLSKARKKFGDKFDYSKFIYINAKTKGIIICQEHGEFLQNPDKHLSSKYGCHECWNNIKKKNVEDKI